MWSFENQVILVTGGSRGIGRATCLAFAELDATVVVNYATQRAAAQEVLDLIQGRGKAGMIHGCDVADAEAVKKMMTTIWDRYGRLDVLVNNAGIWQFAPIRQMAEEVYRRTMAINVDGAFHCCRAAVPLMVRRGGGRIINVASTAGQRGEAFYSPYAASKSAVIGLTKSLAAELADVPILVNCVAPGWVETDMSADALQTRRDELAAAIPLGRTARPEEIAWPIVFLASKGATFITGEIFNVNGGAVLCG